MRLWHYKLISCLPNSQLKSQWRELNSIYKNQPNHILINYVYKFPKEDLYVYSRLVINEMIKRGFKINNYINFNNYFKELNFDNISKNLVPFKSIHDKYYYLICFYNLFEKYIRNQKDFPEENMKKIYDIFINDIN